ncbi:MAG TPA: YbaY family lipoprotein [Candidatus Krumholzibacteria bacterium]|nr:YbaY family lipoprotein [Candidatus Krumholzibacteria bacterium]
MRTTILWLAMSALMAVPVAGCGKGNKEASKVTGTVTYLQSMSLPAGAELHVALQDVSLQDAPARVLAETTIPVGGKQPPFAFALEYDPAQIEQSRTYSVRAELHVDGERRLVSSQSYPVITRGAGSSADIVVMALATRGPESIPLIGTYWKLVEIGGKGVISAGTRREPHITLLSDDNRVAATAGCNQMTGGYTLSGESLTFTQMVSTRMACPDVMDQEAALATALAGTLAYSIDGSELALRDASGAVLARLVAVAHEE